MRKPFLREERYMVEKWKDIFAALTDDDIDMLRHLLWKIHDYRESRGATPYVECVVVEADWPEFEPTWAAIRARVEKEHEHEQAI